MPLTRPVTNTIFLRVVGLIWQPIGMQEQDAQAVGDADDALLTSARGPVLASNVD